MPKKTVILGITGGIAAYKSCELVSRLRKLGYGVRVVMTKNAREFVTPLTFETLSANRVVTDTFDKEREFEVEHISYAKLADAVVIAPATADIITKLSFGIADDMLTTLVLASRAPKIICPSMNTAMYEDVQITKNIEDLKQKGWHIIEPTEGLLACGDTGKGRMSEPADIAAYVDSLLMKNPDYRGKTAIVTAGATREPIDGVRFISNKSSGKMGACLAEALLERGAEVLFIHGYISVDVPKGAESVKVQTTEDMYRAVMDNVKRADIIIKAAAPSDYKVLNYSEKKIKTEKLTLELTKNIDIAKEVGKIKGDKKLVVFAAETDDLLANAHKKLSEKNADLMVANDVTMEGAGFDCDTNIATLIDKSGGITALEKMSKYRLAHEILDALKD